MSQAQITIPPPEQIKQRIDLVREELKSLKKLLQLSMSMVNADQARHQRANDSAFAGIPCG